MRKLIVLLILLLLPAVAQAQIEYACGEVTNITWTALDNVGITDYKIDLSVDDGVCDLSLENLSLRNLR